MAYKASIKYGTFPSEMSIPIVVVKMQDDIAVDYKWKMACPDCVKEGAEVPYSEIGKKQYCKNPNCENHSDFPKESDTLRTLDHKEVYEKVKVDLCKKKASKSLVILGTKPSNFPKYRIVGCQYVVPNVKEEDAEENTSFVVGALLGQLEKADGKVLIVSNNLTSTEKIGMLAVEDGNLLLYEILLDEQIRPLKEQFKLLDWESEEGKDMIKIGSSWLDKIPEFDFASMVSERTINFKALIDGKDIAEMPEQKPKKKRSIKDIALEHTAVETTGTTVNVDQVVDTEVKVKSKAKSKKNNRFNPAGRKQ